MYYLGALHCIRTSFKIRINLPLAFSKDIVEHLKKDFSIILKNNFDIVPEKLAEVSAQVKKYYLGDKEVGVETAEQLTDVRKIK